MVRVAVLVLSLLVVSLASADNPEEGELFEGDMELNPDQVSAINEQVSKNNMFAAIKTNHWKSSGRAETINYYIDSTISGATSAIQQAIREYEAKTCLRFRKLTFRPRGSYLFFTTGTGCSSPVGKMSSGNYIKLAKGCWRKGTIMHEIGHSIGFFHEQSRPDRDRYVTIAYENIKDGKSHNFNKYGYDRIDSRGSPYDYDSMMHYGGTYFSRNRKYTIVTKDRSKQRRIGQRSGFSPTDIKQINKIYC